ncbi:hypothetical protein HPB52_007712 [Rhipicephalus sanguineus]|uniref:Uncharacterized protein n=1 Tax=Rhipicephalus sanguineus TaxID=34632 RepID=A0A9D4Q7S0_RHISA|nr:hypothetical protein HPB52_007712 [Rhipicephalus sanguineus]
MRTRQGGGLNLQAYSPHRILAALTMAARLAPSQRNPSNQGHPHRPETHGHGLPLTCQYHEPRLIRGVDTYFDDAALNRVLIQPRNPSLLGARHIKNTAMVILIFNGLRVPNNIYYGQVICRCMLYKHQIDTCRNYGQVGHHQDVCRTPSSKVCHRCGHLPTDNRHVCNQSVCALCGEAHRTGDCECRHRYHLPYLVHHRRQRRRRRKQAEQQTPTQDPAQFLRRLPNPNDLFQAFLGRVSRVSSGSLSESVSREAQQPPPLDTRR